MHENQGEIEVTHVLEEIVCEAIPCTGAKTENGIDNTKSQERKSKKSESDRTDDKKQ